MSSEDGDPLSWSILDQSQLPEKVGGYRRTNSDADKGKDYIDSRGLQSH